MRLNSQLDFFMSPNENDKNRLKMKPMVKKSIQVTQNKRNNIDNVKQTTVFIIVVIVTSLLVLMLIGIIILLVRKSVIFGNDPLEIAYDDPQKEWDNIYLRFDGRKECTDPTIFVSISSYRDPELCLTVRDLFVKAFNPKRVYVGVVEQNADDDPFSSYIDHLNIPESIREDKSINDSSHIRVIRIDHTDAKGPTFARSLCESLLEDEEYYLLVDSHMRFERGWDCDLIDMLLRCRRPKRSIITCYPEGLVRHQEKDGTIRYEIKERRGYRTQRIQKFNTDGIIEFESLGSFRPAPVVPEYTPFFASCFAFSHSDFVRMVPYPNNTEFLFFGEEMFMATRAFTHGWDLLLPRFSVVYHLWVRAYRPTFVSNEIVRKQSVDHIKKVMNGLIYDRRHKMGNVRTIHQYFDFVGITGLNGSYTRSHHPWTIPKGFKDLNDEFVEKTLYNDVKRLKKLRLRHIFLRK